MSAKQIRILMVCTGNICRSPTAEAVLRALAERDGLSHRLQLDSAGTHGYHVGDAPDPRSQKFAAKRGYDLSALRAREVLPGDFLEYDHILAMDLNNLQNLSRNCPDSQRHKLALYLEFALDQGDRIVPDPYYGQASDFELVLDLCEQAAKATLNKLFKNRVG